MQCQLQSNKFGLFIRPQTDHEQENSIKTEVPIIRADHLFESVEMRMTANKSEKFHSSPPFDRLIECFSF